MRATRVNGYSVVEDGEGVAYLMHDLSHTKHKLTFFQLPTMRATQINGYSLVEDGDVVRLSIV